MKKTKKAYIQLLDEVMNEDSLDYLTVACSTRSKTEASHAKRLIKQGEYGKAMRYADPIGFEVGFRDFK